MSDVRAEAQSALVVTAFSTLLGGLVGVIWYAVAPRIGIVAVANGSGNTMKSLIGDDVWLGTIGALAGVFCVTVLRLTAPRAARGPGAMLGLGVGGLLGMLVAARVGHLIAHPHLYHALRAAFPNVPLQAITYYVHLFDFSVRAQAVLLAWPFVAVFVNAFVGGVQPVNQPTRVPGSTYSGSS